MKITSIMTCCLMFLFVGFISLAQDKDMSPEAGKLFNEGNKLLKAGNYNGAISQYDQALNVEKDYRIYYQKGIAHKKAGEFPKAKEALEQSINLKPGFEGSYNALGGVYFSLGDYEKAVSNFEKVLTTTKSNSTKTTVKKNLSFAYAKMGNEALANGNTTKAAEYLQKAVEYNNYDAAYLSLAKLYTETGQFDKAITASENALKHRSSISKGGPYYYMGLAYKGKKELNKAKQMFTEARADVTYKKTAEYELQLLQ